jgi:hypothetical protein
MPIEKVSPVIPINPNKGNKTRVKLTPKMKAEGRKEADFKYVLSKEMYK